MATAAKLPIFTYPRIIPGEWACRTWLQCNTCQVIRCHIPKPGLSLRQYIQAFPCGHCTRRENVELLDEETALDRLNEKYDAVVEEDPPEWQSMSEVQDAPLGKLNVVTADAVSVKSKPLPPPPEPAPLSAAEEKIKDFLFDLLKDGPVPLNDIHREGRAAGIAKFKLHICKTRLKIKSVKIKDTWYWEII
jgi:hypothetical protein